MAAAVVYDGAGSGGTLFQGKKFWVSQRVPLRPRWVELITANGGEIVPLEKHADVMIADHARKDAPPGSFSWTYIEKSVAKGELEDLEDHRAGPFAGACRPVGSDRPTRGTRTTFSAADDRALAVWVTKAERRGLSTKGNSIYQQLEKINPRHTYQSWRDRWVKYLQHQPRPDLAANDTTPGPVYEQPETSRKHTALSKVSPVERSPSSSSQSKHERQKGREMSKPVTSPKKQLKDQPFTDEDAKLLMAIYDDIINIDEKRVFEAWEKWAENYPQHTASEWFKFWMEDIKPLREVKRRKLTNYPSTNVSIRTRKEHASQAPPAATDHSADQKVPTKHRKSQDSQNPEEARFESDLVEFALNYDIVVDLHPVVSGRQIRLFDLWQQLVDLEFVESTDLHALEKWKNIASRLGFRKSRHPDAPNDLLNIFNSMLADFYEQTSLYREYLHLRNKLDENGRLSETQMERYQSIAPPGHELRFGEGNEIGQQHREHNDDGDDDDDDDKIEIFEIPFSPSPNSLSPTGRPGHSTKSRDGDRIVLLKHDMAATRNQRQGKGKARMLEIPSTPPENLLNSQDRIYDSSPIKDQILNQQHEDETESFSDDGKGMFVKTSMRRMFPKMSQQQLSRIVKVEPETQDFHFSVPAEGSNLKSGSQGISKDTLEASDNVTAVAGSGRDDSSTQSQTNSERDEREVRAFVDHYISLGYPEEVVTQSLLATTLETGDVAMVMEALMQGAGIPENIEGVWTLRDDEAVRLPEHGKEYARVVSKHGEARCVKRRQFLNEEALEDIAQGAILSSQEGS